MRDYGVIIFAHRDALNALRLRYRDRISAYRAAKLARIRDGAEAERGLLAEFCLIEAVHRFDPMYPLPLEIETGPFGKPYLTGGPEISLTHAGDYAAAAVGSRPVGIDLERTRPITESLARRICTPSEWETVWKKNPTDETFRNLFSAKESMVKRSGEGLQSIAKVDVTATDAVRQLFFEDYVLSAVSAPQTGWEVYRCEKDGVSYSRFCF